RQCEVVQTRLFSDIPSLFARVLRSGRFKTHFAPITAGNSESSTPLSSATDRAADEYWGSKARNGYEFAARNLASFAVSPLSPGPNKARPPAPICASHC